MPEDRIQREIEEILGRLDEFVPEGKPAAKRPRPADAAASAGRGAIDLVAGISIRHLLLTSILLIVFGVIGRSMFPFAIWVLVAGVILFLTSFGLSFVSRGSPPPASTEKRWRGRPIDLNEPTFSDRLRAWLQAKRRPRS